MSPELYWLSLTLLMTALFWVPYILDRLVVRGPIAALFDPNAETGHPHSAWAKRAIKAHENAVENLVIFAPAVFVAQALGVSTEITQTAAMAYFFARLAHYLVYVGGVPFLRTLCFAVGWAAQVVIILATLGATT